MGTTVDRYLESHAHIGKKHHGAIVKPTPSTKKPLANLGNVRILLQNDTVHTVFPVSLGSLGTLPSTTLALRHSKRNGKRLEICKKTFEPSDQDVRVLQGHSTHCTRLRASCQKKKISELVIHLLANR